MEKGTRLWKGKTTFDDFKKRKKPQARYTLMTTISFDEFILL